ncbi:MAG TPA: branched-chain amino acid ABC transporter permease [Firmicutes bacterium]|nr:branched-chain amino acid ABC transporter permease [Bacillota bacterium]
MFWLLAQQTLNGLVMGLVYALLALGLTISFGIGRVINFAHGELYMLGAFFTYLAAERVGYLGGIAVALVAMAIAGVMTDRLVLRPLRNRRASIWAPFLATLAVSLVVQNGALAVFGPDPYLLSSPYAYEPIVLAGLVITKQDILIAVVAGLATLLLTVFIKRGKYGLAMRAVARDRQTAALMGIDIDRVYILTFGLSAALAGLAGALVAPKATVDPFMGRMALLKGLSVVILGGLGNIPGAILGGLVLGVAEALGAGFISAAYKDAIGYALMVLVLLFRPEGLLGRRMRRA